MTVNAVPNAGTISGIDSLCPGDTTILTASVTGGVWASSNLSITTISGTGHVTAVATGTDTIKYTVTTSCGSATAIFPFIVRPAGACVTTGMNNVTGTNKIVIAPNPNTGTFTVNLYSTTNEQVHITITNVLGVKVKELTTTTNKQEIIKPDVPAGIYFINATTAQSSYTEKVIIVN